MPRKGYVPTAEHRAKMSAARIGKPFSAEHKHNLAVSRRKRPPASQETRDRISANHADVSGASNPMFDKRGFNSPVSGDKNYRWVHDLSKNAAVLHARLSAKYGWADHCESSDCSGKSVTFEWSNKRHDYKSLDREDWQQLCRSCHQLYDAKHHGSRVPIKSQIAHAALN